jgi:C-terminal processing protease CtpA/Prc
VFPEKGRKMADQLMQEYKAGKFDQAKRWKSFDSLITKSLQKIGNDYHVYAGNNLRIVRELRGFKDEKVETNSPSSADLAKEINYGFNEVKILEGNVGYIKITEINIVEKSVPILFASMQLVENTKALIIDFRNNSGGVGDVGPIVESLFLPANTPLLDFKSREGKGSIDKTLEWIPVKKYEKPLFIIVNKGTASAAEYYSFVLQVRKRAKIVGQSSAGGAHMNDYFVVNDSNFISISTYAPTIPGTEESWEGKGVQPDYVVEVGKEVDFILKLIIQG